MGFPFLPNKTERSKTTFPLKEKTDLLVFMYTPAPSDARGSLRAMRMVRAGRREAFPLFVGSG